MKRMLLALLLASPAVAQQTIPTANKSKITATGGTPRALSDIISDATNILNILPQTSPSVDYTSVLNAALAGSPVPVYLPNAGTSYKFSAQIVLPANSSLVCAPGAVLELTADVSWAFATSGAGARITDCTFQGNSHTGGIGLAQHDHFTWAGGGADHAGAVRVNGTTYANLDRLKFTNGTQQGVYDFGSTHTRVTNTEFQNMASFGIFASGGASKFFYEGNWTDGNAIELIGVDYSGHDGQILGNRAEGTGDNGISVTGYDNVVNGNKAYRNTFGGVVIYGSYNVVTGNKGISNGQVHNPASPFYNAGNAAGYGGLTLTPAFGGAAQSNILSGNFGDDDQATLTQHYDINITGSIYANWAATTAVTAGTYIYSSLGGGIIYKYTVSGTSGSSQPSFTTGTAADGTATLQFIGITPAGTREPSNNVVGPNHYGRALSAPHFDGTVVHNNAVITDAYMQFNGGTSTGGSSSLTQQNNTIYNGLSSKITTIWSSGVVVGYGSMIYNGTNTYRALNSGTSTVQPVHSSGTVTGADSIGWLFLNAGNITPSLTQTGKVTEPLVGFALPVVESATAVCPEFAGTGTPEAKVTSVVCGTYRRSDGGAATTFYVKESGTGNTGWIGK